MRRPRIEDTIRARTLLRWEPWRMYGPAIGSEQPDMPKQDRVYLWTRLGDFARRLGMLRS